VLRVLRFHPQVYERAGFRPSRTVLKTLAWLGIFFAVTIVLAGISADWRPYAVLLGWACAGVITRALWKA
jgi:APA family basic amino acid/polyamine antiporter